MKKILIYGLTAIALAGCAPDPQEKQAIIEKSQTKACVEDIKLGLNDPESLEVIRTEPIPMDDGTYRLSLEYTAKNAMGGRVRGESVCGFKTVDAEVLDPADYLNQQRELSRQMNKVGIRY